MMQMSDSCAAMSIENDCPLFKGMCERELQELERYARLKIITRQQYLCLQNSPSDRVFNIASGCATVEKISNDGRRQILAFVFPGDFVGLSNSDRFEYGIKSLTDMTAYEFQRQKMFSLSEEQMPTLKANLKSIRALVLQMTFDQIYLLGQKKAHERVCFFLMHLLQRMPGATPEFMELPMTRLDIADFLGTTVETISRSMSKLKREGYITTPSPNAITITDLEGVKSLAAID